MLQAHFLNKKIFKNITYSQLSFFVNLISTFILTPFIVKHLGIERYGIWTLLVSFVGNYGLFSLGLRGAIFRYLSESIAKGDVFHVKQIMSTSFLFLSFISLLLFLLALIFVNFLHLFFEIPSYLVQEVKLTFIIVSIMACFNFFGAPFSTFIVSSQRFDVESKINIFICFLKFFAVLIVLAKGHGLVALAMIELLSLFSSFICFFCLTHRFLGAFPVSITLWSSTVLRELLSYGVKSWIINIAVILVYELDLIVISSALSPKYVAIYSVAASLVNYFARFIDNFSRVFFPMIVEKFSIDGLEGLKKFFLQTSFVLYVLSGLFLGGAISFGKEFFLLWLGKDFSASYVILIILMCSHFFSFGSRPCGAVLGTLLNIGFLSFLSLFEGILNLSLSLFWVHKFGIIGVALGTFIPMTINAFFIVPIYTCKKINLSILTYIFSTMFYGVIITLLICVFGYFLNKVMLFYSWPYFFSKVILSVLLSSPFFVYCAKRMEFFYGKFS